MEVNHLSSRLTNRGFSVVALSGELSQAQRTHALQALRDGRASVCVATDVASRGIDLPGLALVIHADIPKNRDILLHRSGRTGRAGSKGISALVVPHNARRRAEMTLRNAGIQAAWGKPPSIEDILKRDRERFLANPALSDPVTDNEKPAIEELLSRYQPEQIAAALMRLHNAHKPAPEELLDIAPIGHGRAERDSGRDRDHNRDDFKNSVWISLSVGHDMSAEPRWILPMLCGRGNITKRNIGAIKIQQKQTHVELTAEGAEAFFKAIGNSGKVEKNITVTRLQGAPAFQEDADDNYKPKKKFDDRKPRREHTQERKPWQEKSDDRKPRYEKSGEKPRYEKSGEKPRHEKSGESDKPKHGFKKKHGAPKPQSAMPAKGKHKARFKR